MQNRCSNKKRNPNDVQIFKKDASLTQHGTNIHLRSERKSIQKSKITENASNHRLYQRANLFSQLRAIAHPTFPTMMRERTKSLTSKAPKELPHKIYKLTSHLILVTNLPWNKRERP